LDEEDAYDAPPDYPGSSAAEGRRDLSPIPPKPFSSAPRQRESLDEEIIFAVGEEDGDKWSDDESPRNSNERERLTGKKD
jgi:hypothetical protein